MTTSAPMEISVSWQSRYASHRDRHFAGNLDVSRDMPGSMQQHISTLRPGEFHEESFGAGVLVPPFDQTRIIEFASTQLGKSLGSHAVSPMLGRFYPQGFVWTVLNCPRDSLEPFRLIKISDEVLGADTNHPLANYPLTLEARYIDGLRSLEPQSSVPHDIAGAVTGDGPGMQAPYPGISTDFYSVYPFRRGNESDDAIFYRSPRLVNHLDDIAIAHVESLYSRLLSSGLRILDLMSGWSSHLPDSLKDFEATGLGLNEEELRVNRQLSSHVVHDLNRNPVLPFEDDAFDAVICTASIEYLIRPVEVIADVARVTVPGGLFVTTFSDRWFPGKEILLWSEMHPFERLGLVLDCYRKTDAFDDLHTESVRGYPRPSDDRHIQVRAESDPILAVWGYVKKSER